MYHLSCIHLHLFSIHLFSLSISSPVGGLIPYLGFLTGSSFRHWLLLPVIGHWAGRCHQAARIFFLELGSRLEWRHRIHSLSSKGNIGTYLVGPLHSEKVLLQLYFVRCSRRQKTYFEEIKLMPFNLHRREKFLAYICIKHSLFRSILWS